MKSTTKLCCFHSVGLFLPFWHCSKFRFCTVEELKTYGVNIWQQETCRHDSLMIKVLKIDKGIKGPKKQEDMFP